MRGTMRGTIVVVTSVVLVTLGVAAAISAAVYVARGRRERGRKEPFPGDDGGVEAENAYRSPAAGGALEPDLERTGALQRNQLYALHRRSMLSTDEEMGGQEEDEVDEGKDGGKDKGEEGKEEEGSSFRSLLRRVPTRADNRLRTHRLHVSQLPPQTRALLRRHLTKAIEAAAGREPPPRLVVLHVERAWIGFVDDGGGKAGALPPAASKRAKRKAEEEGALRHASRDGRLFRVGAVACFRAGAAHSATCVEVVADLVAATGGGAPSGGCSGQGARDRMRIRSLEQVGRLPEDAFTRGGIVPAF